jgi:hypothetical protein
MDDILNLPELSSQACRHSRGTVNLLTSEGYETIIVHEADGQGVNMVLSFFEKALVTRVKRRKPSPINKLERSAKVVLICVGSEPPVYRARRAATSADRRGDVSLGAFRGMARQAAPVVPHPVRKIIYSVGGSAYAAVVSDDLFSKPRRVAKMRILTALTMKHMASDHC